MARLVLFLSDCVLSGPLQSIVITALAVVTLVPTTTRLDWALILQSMGFVIHKGSQPQGWRMSSRTAWLLWPCRHIWGLFRQTQLGGFQRRTPCSNFPSLLHARTPRMKISSLKLGFSSSSQSPKLIQWSSNILK